MKLSHLHWCKYYAWRWWPHMFFHQTEGLESRGSVCRHWAWLRFQWEVWRGRGFLRIGRLLINHLGMDCRFWWRPWSFEDVTGRTVFLGRLAITWEAKS